MLILNDLCGSTNMLGLMVIKASLVFSLFIGIIFHIYQLLKDGD